MTAAQRNIVLGMPGYGKQTSAAGRAFWLASREANICHHYQHGSLLGSNFNQLWCQALNMCHAGQPVDYFAMLHDDVAPEDYWLDKLIDELDTQRLDVLSVVCPIKDSRGMTSMALDNEHDEWMPFGRLSMHDIYELPETFTSADLGRPLLLNTGCWVARWDQQWCRTVHFEVRDRIVFNRVVGRYQAQTIPEDWNFSRQLHEIGTGPTEGLRPLRIGATRKIALRHEGEVEFLNTHPWGRETYDREFCTVSPVAGAFPYEIPGWLLPAEGRQLAELAAGKRVLEIGSYCGLSTVCMARTAQHVTAVDYFDGRATPSPRDTFAEFSRNMHRYGVADRVIAVRPGTPLPLEEYDVVYIDGAHDYDAVNADLALALSVLANDGLIAFHDYHHPSHPGVSEAVDDLVSIGGMVMTVTETLAVVRPFARILQEV